MRLLLLLLAAGSASAQTSAPPAEQKPRPTLNLRLEDSSSAAPRITFEPPRSAVTKEEREKGLPGLGADRRGGIDAPINPRSSGSPIPKSFEPSLNADEQR